MPAVLRWRLRRLPRPPLFAPAAPRWRRLLLPHPFPGELPHLRGPADQSMAAVEQIMLDRINAVLFPQREAGLAPCLANLVLRHLSPTRARPHMVELASIICEWVIA